MGSSVFFIVDVDVNTDIKVLVLLKLITEELIRRRRRKVINIYY